MKNFNDTLENISENFGLHKTVVRERFPRKLQLSEEFVESFKQSAFNSWAVINTCILITAHELTTWLFGRHEGDLMRLS